MKLSHSDFRPKQRAGHVPSTKPRRKLPLLRVLLLVALAGFLYARFDTLWPTVRRVASPSALWHRLPFTGPSPAAALPASPWAYAKDSSRAVLQCPAGLNACCRTLDAGAPGLCGETDALLRKARGFGLLGTAGALLVEARPGPGAPLRLFSVKGHDEKGAFVFQRADAGSPWCDADRGCLTRANPQPPLAQGRAVPLPGETAVKWVSGSSQVRAALAGRVASIDSTEKGPRVWIYHGRELYTGYESLRLAPGVRAGARVNARSILGDALPDSGGFAVAVRVRQGGVNLDPADFFAGAARVP